MHHLSRLILPLATLPLISSAWPKPIPTAPEESRSNCIDFMLPVSVKAQSADYGIASINNNIDVVQWAIDADTWSNQENIIRNITIEEEFQISAFLCVPLQGAKKSFLQIATHGLAFDKRYWDVRINPAQYSYVDAAVAAGYSILTYDRLSTGLSDKPDAYTVATAPVELAILETITEMARNGELLDHASISASNTSFDKIIHVGHSFGSILTTLLLASNGSLSDAAVLTGYQITDHASHGSFFGSFAFQYAAQNDPGRFADRPSGYIIPDTASAIQTGFFSSKIDESTGIGGFDPELLEYANNTKQPGTVGEFASITPGGYAPDFHGALQIMAAQYDYLNCAGDCSDYDRTSINLTYGNASDVDVCLQPGTGHGLTMHRNASIGYQATFDFLAKNGL